MPEELERSGELLVFLRKNWLSLLFWLPATVLFLYNGLSLSLALSRAEALKKVIPFYFQGLKFGGLQDVFARVDSVGYYTDRDLKKDEAASQFSQAQYIVAPVILDLNYTDHDFILLDCTSEDIAYRKIKEIGAIPLRKNQYGVILARRIP